jgi:Txe/YoeB family toxin of toxin-antitoxin system
MPEAKADMDFWIKSGNKPVLKKIVQLLESISTTPYEGIGKPEPLKYSLMGCSGRAELTKNTVLFTKFIQIKLLFFH